MCLNCGCDLPYEDWGSPENITVDTIKKATSTPKALGLSADQVVTRILKTWMKVKESDKNYKSSDKPQNTGDIIDDLMDYGLNKNQAVKESENVDSLLQKPRSAKMKAISKKADNI